MTPDDPTPLEAFGLLVDVKDGILAVAMCEDLPQTATYPDGRKRRWQGRPVFTIRLQNDQTHPPA